jgi:hypothetical protein
MRRPALFVALVLVSSIVAAPHAARAQSDTNCPNVVPALTEYMKIAKATPPDLPVVSAAALRLAEAYDQCGAERLRNRELDQYYQDHYQYSEIREAQYRIVAARVFFQLNKYAEAHDQFQKAEKLAGDVADYTNSSNSGSRISRYNESAVEIRKQAHDAIVALDAAKAGAAPAASAAPVATPAPQR